MVRRAPQQRGFTYLLLLLSVALIGTLLATTGRYWAFQQQRSKELELLRAGLAIRQAIQRYYESSPGSVKRYPARLEDLLEDRRFLAIRRHLRRIPVDPFTGQADWVLLTAPEGGIQGVHSLSDQESIKQAEFPEGVWLENGTHYSGWVFAWRAK
ncbi:type II secretion system protein [Leeia aquatica]|uniref:Type II secretion system protein n=1 Tax=Leeia aquatica TaxID=2725557 RepID=A0A847S1M8_9NEIS|nr:type II secretion system protein [Leeia aquatica]NLR75751.1 type II secretion system protein [Leeia aquatica]